MYNNDNTKKLLYAYGADGSIASTFDSATGEKTKFVYDLANRQVGEKTYIGNTLSSSLSYTYADKTNYLTGVSHFSALGTQNIGYRYGNLSSGEMPDQIYGVKWNGAEKVSYTYDGLGRLTNKKVNPTLSNSLNNNYTYVDVQNSNKTTTLVNSVATAAGTYSYVYDAVGNITSVSDGTYTTSYEYDDLNQLTRENNQRANTTTVYTYTNGNITSKKEYAYTVGAVGAQIDSTSWSYTDSTWGDLLTSWNGESVTSDAIGNPLSIGNISFSWLGRQLQTLSFDGMNISYGYNTDGQRVRKTVNGVNTEYIYNGSILAGQKTGNDQIVFMYDNNGDAFGFNYNGADYYYIKNAQNDVTAIADSTGTVVVNYYYDAWGNTLNITGTLADTIGDINPIRYRSYYCETELDGGMYYLNSRYYLPGMCRFLNADSFTQTGQGVLDKNMFAYCMNNPVNSIDQSGKSWASIKGWFSEKYNKVKETIKSTINYIKQPTYKTVDEAATASGTQLNNQTQSDNREHAQGIVKTKITKRYKLTKVVDGKHNTVDYGNILNEDSLVALVHSHPCCTGHIGNEFSNVIYDSNGNKYGDWAVASSNSVDEYLAAPNGCLYVMRWDLGEYNQSLVSSDLPVDDSPINCE